MALFLPMEGVMGMSVRQENAVFAFILLACLAAGLWAGTKFTWGFILVYSIIGVIGGIINLVVTMDSRQSGAMRVGFAFGVFLFLIASWCSFWISLTGIFR